MVHRPNQKLSARRAHLPIDETLYDGTPPHLIAPLQNWVSNVAIQELARLICVHLRIPVHGPIFRAQLALTDGDTLLDVIDATLQLHPSWDDPQTEDWWDERPWELDQLLTTGGSLFKVDRAGRCLIERLDETIQNATGQVILDASPAVSDHVKAAWAAAYGRNPDPDKVFNEAIRAVEEVACPLVERKKAMANKATLGTVIGELRSAQHKWRISLPDKDGMPQVADVVVSMMETLWQAQVSRHGGGPKSRRHTPEEAKAALHLAIMLLQWLQSDVLQPVP